jgi:hypothetical protein
MAPLALNLIAVLRSAFKTVRDVVAKSGKRLASKKRPTITGRPLLAEEGTRCDSDALARPLELRF